MGNKEHIPERYLNYMKTYSNLYEKMLDLDNIKDCIKKATKGKKKRRRKHVQHLLANLDEAAVQVRDLITSGKFHFHESNKAVINESSQRKNRLIAKPRLMDQIIHHVLMSVFKDIVLNSLYEQVYGSIPGRGAQRQAKRYLKKWIGKYKNKRFYVFKYDVKSFYDSVDHTILKNKLQRKINDTRYLDLLFQLIDSYEEGLPKGYYSSQWLANFYLSDLDHYIKNVIMAPQYMRYMDDMVILCPNKRKLRKMKETIEEYLNVKLNLKLKGNWQIYRFVDSENKNGRDIDFMGMRFFRTKIILRKSLLKRIYRKALKLNNKRELYNQGIGTGVTYRDAMSMLSLLGWTKHTDVYNYYQKYLKPLINPRYLRKKVAAHSRKELMNEVQAGLREPPKSRKARNSYYYKQWLQTKAA